MTDSPHITGKSFDCMITDDLSDSTFSNSWPYSMIDILKENAMNISIETYTHLKDAARKDLILAEFLAQLQKDNGFNFVTDFEKFPAIIRSDNS